MDWRDCVVVYIDLIDVKKRTSGPKSEGSSLMRAFHDLVVNEMKRGLASLEHAYAWNDSALLLGYVGESTEAYQECLQDAETLKGRVDAISKSYAIAVKGQAFPLALDSVAGVEAMKGGRATILRTSSYAMANCFEIEREVRRRKLRHAWYLDSRILDHIKTVTPNGVFKLKLLPNRRPRNVYSFSGYLWKGRGESRRDDMSGGL